MRFGFANIYSWRPHVEHLFYLATVIGRAGHETAFLTCDSSVGDCYTRLLKDKGRLRECPTCMLGGVRSYPVSNVTSISAGKSLDSETLQRLALSSSCTLTRIETDVEWLESKPTTIRQKLSDPIDAAYTSARRWIADQRLDAVVCFNGRMDMTAGIILACEHAGIPYLTHERAWFGDGLYLNPNANCLSLAAISEMVREFDDKPLTAPQAAFAGRLAAERFLKRNSLEWRLYNADAVAATWPLETNGPRVLVLPSSRNEVAGQSDWASGWTDNTHALDDFFAAFSIAPGQVVVRCHPNWAENIGAVDGNRSLRHYKNWCATRGIHCISSEQKQSTYDLIQEADIIVLNGGSSAVEAGACGKQIYSFGPSFYKDAGFLHNIRDVTDLHDPRLRTPIDPETVVRKTMRFLYLNARRFPQFCRHVRAIQTTQFEYFDGADADRLIAMLKTGKVQPDDADFADSGDEETKIVQALLNRDWEALASFVPRYPDAPPLDIGRRKGLRWIDPARGRIAKGDHG